MAFDRRQVLNDPVETQKIIFEGQQSSIWTALPAIVQSVDFSTMTCSCQPSIQGKTLNEDGSVSVVNLPVLIHVPICFPSAGGFTITFPMAAGDEVLVVFASRCIDSWWALGGIGVPMEPRMHDLSDGFCIPGPKSVPNVIPSISTNSVQIRNNTGTAYIELTATGINLVGNVSVTGTLNASGEITHSGIGLSSHHHTSASPGNPTGPALPWRIF